MPYARVLLLTVIVVIAGLAVAAYLFRALDVPQVDVVPIPDEAEKTPVGVNTSGNKDASSLSVMVAGPRREISLAVVDPTGQITGTEPITGTGTEDIPNSAYFIDAIADDVTGAPATSETHQVFINRPEAGTYTISVKSLAPTSFTLSIGGSAADGSYQGRTDIPVRTSSAGVSKFEVVYDPAPGHQTRVTQLVTGR